MVRFVTTIPTYGYGVFKHNGVRSTNVLFCVLFYGVLLTSVFRVSEMDRLTPLYHVTHVQTVAVVFIKPSQIAMLNWFTTVRVRCAGFHLLSVISVRFTDYYGTVNYLTEPKNISGPLTGDSLISILVLRYIYLITRWIGFFVLIIHANYHEISTVRSLLVSYLVYDGSRVTWGFSGFYRHRISVFNADYGDSIL